MSNGDARHTAPSYRRCERCKPPVDCAHIADSTPERPCWGEVMIEFEFEDGGRLHTCRGHQWIWSDVFYRDYVAEGEPWPKH